ncbi:MAG: hypothetical protein ACRD29_14990 [Acidimicrobiales bacterium]
MSDYPVGPDWWQASDGRWYPPQTRPQQPLQPPAPQGGYAGYQQYQPTQPMPPAAPPPKSKAPLVVALVVVVALIAGAVGFLLIRDGDDGEAADDATTTTEDENTTTTTEAPAGDLDIDVPDGFEPVVNEDEGFAIAVPDDWQEFDLTDESLDQIIEDVVETNPELGPTLQPAAGLLASGGVLLALGPTETAFTPNVNILRIRGTNDVNELEPLAQSELARVGATNVDTEVIDIPAGESLRAEYDLTVNDINGQPVDAHGVQYHVAGAGFMWTITFSTDDIALDADTFDEMIDSFTVPD